MAQLLERAESLAEESRAKAKALYDAYYDQEAPTPHGHTDSTRGSEWSGMLTCLSRPLLRFGFLLQTVALLAGFILFYSEGASGVFSFDLFSTPEALRTSKAYSYNMVLLESATLLGALCIAGFQIYVADDSKAARGFRAGSKLLSTAATLDIIVAALRLMQYFYAYNFLGNRWWHRYTQSNTDWCLFHATGWLHSIALALYGIAIFYIESYHEEGTYEEWSWICLSLFGVASLTENALVFTHVGAFSTVLHLCALIAASLWSCAFEPMIGSKAPSFHDRDINSGISSEEPADTAYGAAGAQTGTV